MTSLLDSILQFQLAGRAAVARPLAAPAPTAAELEANRLRDQAHAEMMAAHDEALGFGYDSAFFWRVLADGPDLSAVRRRLGLAQPGAVSPAAPGANYGWDAIFARVRAER